MQLDGFLFFLLVICLGYFAARLHLVKESAAEVLPSLLLNVCFPALLLTTFASVDRQTLLAAGLPALIATPVFALLPFLVSLFLFRRDEPERRALLRYISGIGNTSFVCIPLLRLFLPDEQMLIVFVHGAVMDLLIWGLHHPLFLGSGLRKNRQPLHKLLLSPCLLAVVVGTILSVTGMPLPSFLQFTADALATVVSPLSLLLIGILIQQYGLLAWRKDRTAILYSLWKVIVYPCLVFAALYFFLPLQSALILAILFGSPAPVTAVVWCKEYRRDTKLAVDCLIPSTILYFLVMGGALTVLTHLGILG